MLNVPTDSERLDNGDVYLQAAPFYRNEERLVSEALMIATVPGQVLQARVRPNLPQVDPFPPRWGYLPYTARQASVEEILGETRNFRNRRDDISGGPAGWQAASRNVGAGSW